MCSAHPPNLYGPKHFGIIPLIQAILNSVREKTQGCFYPYFPATLSTDSGCGVMGPCAPVIFCGGPQLSLSLSKLLGNPLSSPRCKCHISRAGERCIGRIWPTQASHWVTHTSEVVLRQEDRGLLPHRGRGNSRGSQVGESRSQTGLAPIRGALPQTTAQVLFFKQI